MRQVLAIFRGCSAVGLVGAVLVLSGCASMVNAPAVNQVQRAAIISLYANEKVPNDGGRGVVKDWDDKVKLQVAEDALITFTNELSHLGWQMVPPDDVVQSSEYREAFMPAEIDQNSMLGKLAGLAQQSYRRRFFAPAGMMPIEFSQQEANTRSFGDAAADDTKQQLADMAKRLGVDAVVIVQIDYCYGGGTFSLLGTGQAVMTAASSIKAVNQAGEVIINMPDLPVCGGKERGRSETSAAMINGDLLFTHSAANRFRQMFIEATRENAEQTRDMIVKALRG